MGNHYEHSISERLGSNGKKLYHEEYLINRQKPLSSTLLQYHSYLDSIWYPKYKFVNREILIFSCLLIEHGRLKCPNDTHPIAIPGDFVIGRMPEGETWRVFGDKCLCWTGILFTKNFFSMMLFNALFPKPFTTIRLKNPERISNLLASIKKAILEDADDLDCVMHGLTFQMLYEVYRQHNQTDYPDELSKALQFINMMGAKKISHSDIAASCGVSTRTLTRLFRDYLNCAPGQFMMKKRLEQAKNMLSLHKIRIKVIADLCGFYSAAHLTRMFKQQYGVSPLYYRNNSK